MVDYSKWDALELSDDSDIEVHPNVDKRSFIRAKRDQIHMERQQRQLQVEALKYERAVNNGLVERLSSLHSALESHAPAAENRPPAEVAFQAIMELTPRNPEDDNPPPPPNGLLSVDEVPPTYSKMMARILDDVNKKLDERKVQQSERYIAFVEEIGVHIRNIRDLQDKAAEKLDELEKKDAKKITSESYHVGFDSSHVSKGKPGEHSTKDGKPELLNPNFDLANDGPSMSSETMTAFLSDEKIKISPIAKRFAQIKPSNYTASHDIISSHPDLLQESETDSLLIEAFNLLLDHNDEPLAWQYVHQALLLPWCRRLGRDGTALFFKRIASPGHQVREVFRKEVDEKFRRMRELAKENARQRAAESSDATEQIQLHAVDPGTSIQIRIPETDSEDIEVQKARTIFDGFTPEMKAALESGLLSKVNEVLGAMEVPEAEHMVGLLGDAGCLSLEEEIIDATSEEGKQRLRDIEEEAAKLETATQAE
ncbi:Cdc37 N terminal kinase binding-domain-containing protein [Nemania sp. FL0031]|nr:Cdc37 N terminal kinase binding-domain-containing protein [Nemania sp. FL0031]